MLGLRSRLLDSVPAVSHRFFGAVGGTSPAPWRGLNVAANVGDAPARVEENLARVRFQLGVDRRSLFTVSQVHGSSVIVVDEGADREQVALREADALVTKASGPGLGIRTADCAPILLTSRDGEVVGAAHAGWRGAVGGVIEATLEAMEKLGAPADSVVAAVGPCIGLGSFEVGPEVIEAASKFRLDGLVRSGEGDRMFLDLAGLCLRVLDQLGVEAERVGGCTFTSWSQDRPTYFSHRRDRGKTGRQMSAIAKVEPPVLDAAMFR